ncbi:MAG: hypothetical protein Q8P95_04510, partial [bacterium]|nr:hypothetical protein [bacterium]
NVIPKLKELNPNLLETFANNARLCRMAAEFFTQRANEFLSHQTISPGRYDLKSFLTLSEKEQSFVLRQIFEDVHGHKRNLIQEHLEQVLGVLRTNASGKQKEFGPGKVLVREREWFEVKDA